MDRHACVIGEERGIILIVDSSESRMEDEPPRHPSPEIRNNFGLVELTKEAGNMFQLLITRLVTNDNSTNSIAGFRSLQLWFDMP
ncbi:hypothetical protein QR680_014448 [Steinernema hermaphroditum]|uniref:Uncharacterized protein n=1 Tax=Steinernema hermaphroditum TaxID=289476 RepID=A0AA39IBK6_9BILA|nr:hypothetical protein QR680_014448 [Steinernema hermaphroditum]